MLLKYWETWFPNSNYPPWEVKFHFSSRVCVCMHLPGGSAVKNLPAMQEPQETQVRSLGQEDAPEEGTATHSSIPTWRIPWTEEAWPTTVHGVAKNWTRLKWLSTHVCVWGRGGFMGSEFFSLYLFYVFQVIYHFKEGINFYQIKICFLKMKRFVLEV